MENILTLHYIRGLAAKPYQGISARDAERLCATVTALEEALRVYADPANFAEGDDDPKETSVKLLAALEGKEKG
jgi:hypothetical protein